MATPQRRKQEDNLPFTPDKIGLKGCRLVYGGDTPRETVDIVRQAEDHQAARKRKRTGKALPISSRITAEKYVERWLAEMNITYRSWTCEHRRECVHVRGRHLCPYGFWNSFMLSVAPLFTIQPTVFLFQYVSRIMYTEII